MPTQRLTPLAAARRHLPLAVLAVLIGTALGVGLAISRPPTYSAEARLAVGSTSLTAQAVPGYALAAQELAANYARYVNNAEEQSALQRDLHLGAGAIASVSASPIPESNVVRIEVTGSKEATAVAAAARVATSLIHLVNNSAAANTTAADILKQYTDISTRVATAQQAVTAAQSAVASAVAQQPADPIVLPSLRQTAIAAAAKLAILQVQQEALSDKYRSVVSDNSGVSTQLLLVEHAVGTGSDRTTRAEQFGLAGLAAGCALALLLAVAAERRRLRRVRRPVVPPVSPDDDDARPTSQSSLPRTRTGVGDRSA